MQKSILVAVKTAKAGEKLKKILTSQGYLVAIVEDPFSALRILRSQNISLSLIDNDLKGLNGIQLAKIMAEEALGPVIILSQHPVETGNNPPNSLYGLLTKPITEYQLVNTIKLALIQFENRVGLEMEVETLKDALETRKIIEKAKGILMRKYDMTEETAYEKIRKTGMEKRTKLKNVAEAIILME